MLELAARFSETLYRGPLAREVAQADGAVKGQDKWALPAHDSPTGLCIYGSQGEKRRFAFSSCSHQNIFPILLFLRSLAHGNIMCRGALLLYTVFRKIYKTVMAIKSFSHVELFI